MLWTCKSHAIIRNNNLNVTYPWNDVIAVEEKFPLLDFVVRINHNEIFWTTSLKCLILILPSASTPLPHCNLGIDLVGLDPSPYRSLALSTNSNSTKPYFCLYSCLKPQIVRNWNVAIYVHHACCSICKFLLLLLTFYLV